MPKQEFLLEESASVGQLPSIQYVGETLAYRMRGVIACIQGYADLLGDLVSDDEQRDMVLRILEGTSQIEHMLTDLLLFSKPLNLAPECHSVHEIVNSLLLSYDDHYRSRITFKNEVRHDDMLSIDIKLTREALFALTKNAFEASTGDAPIQIVARGKGKELNILVRNIGPLPRHVEKHLMFDAFYSTKPQNLGLGLSIARTIVESHGGAVSFIPESDNKYTTFEISLPYS